MRDTGYYLVNYFSKWVVLEYVQIGTKVNPKYQWVGTIDGAVVVATENDLFEIKQKVA